MTLPQANVLCAHWEQIPPPAYQLKRIALALGLPDPKPSRPVAQSAEDVLREAMAGGLGVAEGRPDDPMLDLVGW